MQQMTKAATVSTTDVGEFTALAATWDRDRDGDRIERGAFANSIRRWQGSGKAIPLHWDHRGAPSDIIGAIDAMSLKETAEGLRVQGRLDLEDSETAREVWRLMRRNAVSLSFGT
jgi:HK97 family phage prohead protease